MPMTLLMMMRWVTNPSSILYTCTSDMYCWSECHHILSEISHPMYPDILSFGGIQNWNEQHGQGWQIWSMIQDKTLEWMVKLWSTLVRGIVTIKRQLLNSLFEQQFEAIHITMTPGCQQLAKSLSAANTGCSCVVCTEKETTYLGITQPRRTWVRPVGFGSAWSILCTVHTGWLGWRWVAHSRIHLVLAF